MKVKEVITLKGWNDGSGLSWEETYATNIIEIDEIPQSSEDLDWSWYELPADNPEEAGEDVEIVVEYYAEDADIKDDIPFATLSTWESELWKEKNSK